MLSRSLFRFSNVAISQTAFAGRRLPLASVHTSPFRTSRFLAATGQPLACQQAMSMQNLKAQCLCGACKIRIAGPPKFVVNCHCSQCRRALSSSFGTLVGFPAGAIEVVEGADKIVSFSTGKEERLSCAMCSSKVFAKLHHLNHWAVYQDMFTSPNHGPDGKIHPDFEPTAHIFYTSGTLKVNDQLPKFVNLPTAFGGTGETVE